jgi:hypothetical protein
LHTAHKSHNATIKKSSPPEGNPMAQHDLDADIHKNRLLQEIDAAITEVN